MIRILLLEDNEDLNASVCRHLSLNNYSVTGCTNAMDAYDALYDQKFDLIISDIMMSGVDGFEFAKSVREENPSIPIIFMTAKIVVPVIFFHVFGSSYEAAFYGVWYSVVFSELLAVIMTIGFLWKYRKKYQYA